MNKSSDIVNLRNIRTGPARLNQLDTRKTYLLYGYINNIHVYMFLYMCLLLMFSSVVIHYRSSRHYK